MAYGDFKDLPRRAAADKVLHDKLFNLAENLKHDEYQRGLLKKFLIETKEQELILV